MFPYKSRSRLDIDLRDDWNSSKNITTLLDSGRVGIGITNPSSKFVVYGSDATADGKDAALQISNTATGGSDFYLRTGASGTNTGPGSFSISDKFLNTCNFK